MLAPSTTGYVPLDSGAPAAFSQTQNNNYMIIAFIMLVLYDHVITLDNEIEWIWTLRWRLPKIIFIVNRYVITCLLLTESVPNFVFPVTTSFCEFRRYQALLVQIANFGAAELIIIIRVCSLYGNRKLVVWSLRIFFVLAFINAIVNAMLFVRAWKFGLYYKFLPGCWTWSTENNNTQWHSWISFLTVEGVLMLLTAYKLLSYRDQMNRTVTLLARDSIVYFIIVFACLAFILASQVDLNIPVDVVIPSQCITSIAVGRMMMNIRGLVLDDPEHTVHLQTPQLTARTNPGLDIEEVLREV